MELILLILLPVVAGALLNTLFCRFRAKHPTAINWPPLLCCAFIGTAANNVAAVFFTGTWTILDYGGGFLPDSFGTLLVGVMLTIAAFIGLVVCRFHPRRSVSGAPHPVSAWIWSWVLTQSLFSVLAVLTGTLIGFKVFEDGPGLPLAAYLLLSGLLLLVLGFLFARKWPSESKIVPLIGCAVLCSVTALLLTLTITQSNDPTWGLSLVQTPAGVWYTRLDLPAALLLGDYQYAWEVTTPGLWLSALAPHVLFTVGYLIPKAFK